ncbi:MAG TPA: hypothetical protein G4O02_04720 [Caldilineae bacterium]|nr:hypothetical protein [Caldilineae bacterium]
MTDKDGLAQIIQAGEIVKPWLILGPFYEDLSDKIRGLSFFERPGATAGRAEMTEVVQEAMSLLTAMPREGDVGSFRGQTARWSLVRGPEKYLSWGEYHISNHLVAAFLSTIVTPGKPGVRRWRLRVGLPSRVIVAVNRTVIYDTDTRPARRSDLMHEYEFEADLREGENTVTVALFRIARMAQVGFRLEVMDDDVEVRVPLAEGMSLDTRARLEEEVASIRLARDIFYPEHDVGIRLNTAPGPDTRLIVRLTSQSGNVIRQATPTTAGIVRLCRGDELDDGVYRIVCTWETHDGKPITSTRYEIRKVTPAPPIIGYDRFEERRRQVLELHATERDHDRGHRPNIWREVARYALGRYDEVDEAVIRDTCAFIAARKDCADFVIQGLLRLMYWERENPRLSPEINALMKDTVLGFKYWVDEPGDTVMYMGSENHRLLFHVAEWMAGQLFPTEEFTNSRQRGLYHATKGRMYITEWLRQRGRFGFDEWHSNSYYPVCIAPLVNVYDFAIYEDDKLRQMAGAVLDYMCFNLAADSLHGVFGTTHGRSYGIYVKYPDLEGTAATCWLLYGTGSLVRGTSGMAPVSLATSIYRPPRLFSDIALDDQAVVESKQRQGILRGSARHADFCVYRTPDYMISGLQDHRKGEFEPSTHVAQVTLGNKVVIFWSCPHTTGEGSGLRPDYWSGNTTLPRVIQYRNVMSLTWRLSPFNWMTHCFFEQERMDEVRFEGKWAFARVGHGYVGIYSQHGMEIGDYGQYAGRELICRAPENTWLVECGREADWGSFDAFVDALKRAPIEVTDEAITYTSPSIGRFVTGWDVTPTVNGEPIQLHGYPLVDSPWAHSDFGSGELTIRYGDEVYEIWFNQ